MRRFSPTLAAAVLACALGPPGATLLDALGPAPAQAAFGLSQFETGFAGPTGAEATQAGSHPHALETFLEWNDSPAEPGEFLPDGGDTKNLFLEQVTGLSGDTTAVEPCSTVDFATIVAQLPSCPDETAVGITAVAINRPLDHPVEGAFTVPAAIYNLAPPPGVPLRLGFVIERIPVTIDVSIEPTPPYNAIARTTNSPQVATLFATAVQLWGVPGDPAHDFARGRCAVIALPNATENIIGGRLNLIDDGDPANDCAAGGGDPRPFLTLPRACGGQPLTRYEMNSWAEPGTWVRGSDPAPPFTGCGAARVPFDPEISSGATTEAAASASGQDFELDFVDEQDGALGLTEAGGIAHSDMKKIVVTLPEGMTANPSLAEGLGVCGRGDLGRETLASDPGEGCPLDSKLGEVEVETPIVEDAVAGSVFLAEPFRNPFGSLLALYVVLKDKGLGLLVKQAGEVSPDPETGQLIASFDEIAQQPFTRLRFRFSEGQRAPLITPPRCGTHTTLAEITPWARPSEVVRRTASFRLARGPGGGPCPPGGALPFAPGFEAGSLNNSAGAYSPFLMRLTRADGEQDMTRFSALLPRGVLAKIAGVARCPEAAIAAAAGREGRDELAAPSCPPASQIGRTLAAAGVGSSLTHVGGALYLAGPYNGAPLSVVAIVPAVAGPFDVGTVVVRVALALDPRSGEAIVDGSRSDPIPHILAGIPLNVRDLRVFAERPGFALNPTSCAEKQTAAALFGSFADPLDPADDRPVGLFARYQAADCAALPFAPRLALRLKGATRRGAFPALRAVYRPRPGHANIRRLALRFPRSAFVEQGHFRTICTRVQFAAPPGHGARCPEGSIYGRARAFTPLLDAPLEGPVYLRSSNNNLPDAVFALRGIVDLEVAVRIDSVKGGLRATVQDAPDAPVSRVVVDMRGGQKGLFVNSRDLCKARNRATAKLTAQSAKRATLRPLVRPGCKRGKRGRAGR